MIDATISKKGTRRSCGVLVAVVHMDGGELMNWIIWGSWAVGGRVGRTGSERKSWRRVTSAWREEIAEPPN